MPLLPTANSAEQRTVIRVTPAVLATDLFAYVLRVQYRRFVGWERV